ncbi:Hypothetical predicted protein [Paramuricea clavata]|uniref:Mutator-like transposase domain-containing protein n=1 Tax=Paramuricea clavata TaxID=317549 RepID=A0A6S7ITZ5_PARCT|nr:Hypothetical predicted protein [Paramuricea clavata]
MAARFKIRSLTRKFEKIQKRNRGNIIKLQEGLQAWKTENISSEVEENEDEIEEFEPATDILINTRARQAHGSRIVDINQLRKGLESCEFCKERPLSLRNVQQEKLYGPASKLDIQCQFCGQTNVVETSLAHKTGASGPMAYDINSKSVLASLYTGIAREASKAVEAVAGHTCVETIEIEKEHAIKIGERPDENNLVPISCLYDMGWQKRGKAFNSNRGQGAVMGLYTGKKMDYTTKTKKYRICDHDKKMNSTPRKHDCRKNHSGSSKDIEPTSAVQLFNNITKHNAKYSTCTGDDDSTTECFIHAQVPYRVEKFSDIIHIKRSLTSRSHNLAKMKRFPDCSSLSRKVIDYLVKCFSVAVNQNKGDPKSMQASLNT